jgi:uncharacterized membrane protein YkoI
MTVRRRTFLAACAVALTLAHAPAWADREHGHGGGDNNEGLTPDQAAAVVKRAYDGRVVSVKQEGSNGQRSYKVRVLLDGGRVKTVQVDSRGNMREAN